MYSLQSSLDVLLGERLVSGFDSQAYVDWALQAMVAGHESESLHILVGLDREPTQMREYYLSSTAQELGLKILTGEDEVLRRYADWVATEVVSGHLSPEKGLEKLCDIYTASDYSVDYKVFDELMEDLEGLRSGHGTIYGEIRHLGEKDHVIIHICSLFLSCPLQLSSPTVHKSYELDRAYCHRCRERVHHHYVSRWSSWFPPRRRRVAMCSQCGVTKVAVPGEGDARLR